MLHWEDWTADHCKAFRKEDAFLLVVVEVRGEKSRLVGHYNTFEGGRFAVGVCYSANRNLGKYTAQSQVVPGEAGGVASSRLAQEAEGSTVHLYCSSLCPSSRF